MKGIDSNGLLGGKPREIKDSTRTEWIPNQPIHAHDIPRRAKIPKQNPILRALNLKTGTLNPGSHQ